jgi:N4-gp56 family major capsid protein
MANFTWSFDAPSGVFKNHEMSSLLRQAAIAETKFMQFVKPEPGYGRRSGESITITRISNLSVPTSGQLTEGIKVPEDDLSISTVAITVVEWGRSVPYTSFGDDLSEFNIENIVQRVLKDQMRLVLDNAAASAFKSTSNKIKYAPTGVAAGTFDTDGTMSTTALANLNMFHVEAIRDYMYATLNIPAYEGDDYMCILSTKAKRGLMSDPAWIDWHKYTDPEAKYNGEIGRIENIRFVESNHTSALSGSKGSGGVLGEAVFFGADAVAMAVVLDPELRAALPGDFGRQKAVAWYGILQFGVIWDTANAGEARIVTVTSA